MFHKRRILQLHFSCHNSFLDNPLKLADVRTASVPSTGFVETKTIEEDSLPVLSYHSRLGWVGLNFPVRLKFLLLPLPVRSVLHAPSGSYQSPVPHKIWHQLFLLVLSLHTVRYTSSPRHFSILPRFLSCSNPLYVPPEIPVVLSDSTPAVHPVSVLEPFFVFVPRYHLPVKDGWEPWCAYGDWGFYPLPSSDHGLLDLRSSLLRLTVLLRIFLQAQYFLP